MISPTRTSPLSKYLNRFNKDSKDPFYPYKTQNIKPKQLQRNIPTLINTSKLSKKAETQKQIAIQSEVKIEPRQILTSRTEEKKAAQQRLLAFRKNQIKIREERAESKESTFRRTFCVSKTLKKNKQRENPEGPIRLPTTSIEEPRPATRIRKTCNIGEETNKNFLSKYEIIKELGKGTYGTVFLAKVKPQSFASKRLMRRFQNNSECSVRPLGNDSTLQLQVNPISTEMTLKIDDFQTIDESTPGSPVPAKKQQEHVAEIENKSELLFQPKAENEEDELVAIKVYEKFAMNNKDPSKFKNIRKQITVMQNLEHKNITKLYESVESITKISLVVEYGGDSSLLDYMKKNFPLSEEKVRSFAIQLLDVLSYLHGKNIVHRDVKPQNILIRTVKKKSDKNDILRKEGYESETVEQTEEVLKLIDYGFSTLTNKNRKLNCICGTPNYMAPELLNTKEYVGQKADTWSFGVVVFVMAQGRYPFKSDRYEDLARLVSKGKFTFKRKHSEDFKGLINRILKVDPDVRPNCQQIRKFPWISQDIKETN